MQVEMPLTMLLFFAEFLSDCLEIDCISFIASFAERVHFALRKSTENQ